MSRYDVWLGSSANGPTRLPTPFRSPWRGLRRGTFRFVRCDANAVDDDDASFTGTRDYRGAFWMTAPRLEERRDYRRRTRLGIEARCDDERFIGPVPVRIGAKIGRDVEKRQAVAVDFHGGQPAHAGRRGGARGK